MSQRVLVVDDEPSTVRMVQMALEGEGLEVTTAANGAECLLAVAASRPDLVILDVMMPVLDGFETLRLLRAKGETQELPIILLTARREDRDIARGLMGRADLYLTKPFEVDELLTAVRRILEVAAESVGDPDRSSDSEPP